MNLQWKSRGPRSTRMGLVAATVVALVGVACSNRRLGDAAGARDGPAGAEY